MEWLIWIFIILLALFASGTTIRITTLKRCEKCGSSDHQVRYAPAGTSKIFLGHVVESRDEALFYTCQKCGYQWFEPVVPAKKSKVSDVDESLRKAWEDHISRQK